MKLIYNEINILTVRVQLARKQEPSYVKTRISRLSLVFVDPRTMEISCLFLKDVVTLLSNKIYGF